MGLSGLRRRTLTFPSGSPPGSRPPAPIQSAALGAGPSNVHTHASIHQRKETSGSAVAGNHRVGGASRLLEEPAVEAVVDAAGGLAGSRVQCKSGAWSRVARSPAEVAHRCLRVMDEGPQVRRLWKRRQLLHRRVARCCVLSPTFGSLRRKFACVAERGRAVTAKPSTANDTDRHLGATSVVRKRGCARFAQHLAVLSIGTMILKGDACRQGLTHERAVLSISRPICGSMKLSGRQHAGLPEPPTCRRPHLLNLRGRVIAVEQQSVPRTGCPEAQECALRRCKLLKRGGRTCNMNKLGERREGRGFWGPVPSRPGPAWSRALLRRQGLAPATRPHGVIGGGLS